MNEIAPDRPDFNEYEAEMERVHRHNKRIQRDCERLEQEKEEYEFISD